MDLSSTSSPQQQHAMPEPARGSVARLVSTTIDTTPIGNHTTENQRKSWIQFWLTLAIVVCEIALECFELWQVNDPDLADIMPTISTMMSILRTLLVWRMQAYGVCTLGNVALVQAQSIIVVFCLSAVTIATSAVAKGLLSIDRAMLLMTVTISTTVIAYVLPDVVLLRLQRRQPNPDCPAAQLASLAGSVISTMIFAVVETLLLNYLEMHLWITYGVLILCILICVACVYIINEQKRSLTSGWQGILPALVICIIKQFIVRYAAHEKTHNRVLALHIITNGINSNFIALQYNKMSNLLLEKHTRGILGEQMKVFELPWKALFTGAQYATAPVLLLIAAILAPLPLIGLVELIKYQRLTFALEIVVAVLLFSMVHITLVLYIAHVCIHMLWKIKSKHDSSVNASLVAFSELLNWSFMVLAFWILDIVG